MAEVDSGDCSLRQGWMPWLAGSLGWSSLLLGQFLFVFAVVAVSGPGRIDIVDGQTRYEVARSLVDHGDSVIRNDQLWWCVFPGRDGQLYSNYRFPQSVLGVPAILLADVTGPRSEGRRHFFFALTSAACCALLAVVYTLWFRGMGHSPVSAAGWGTAGIFCTPNWFYGTSTFDDILGAAAVVLAVALGWAASRRGGASYAALAGLALGWAYNCKQPLGIFVLPVLAASLRGWRWPEGKRDCLAVGARVGLITLGLALGIAACRAYDGYKFPPGTTADHGRLFERYAPAWPGNPVAGVMGLCLSPAAGAFWYCPPLVLAILGARAWLRGERWLTRSVWGASAIFAAFVATTAIFKGDPCWGPRYLTPVFALVWIFVPAGARALGRRSAMLWLALGFLVQLGALAVDPHRLYVEQQLPSAFGVVRPWLYFHPHAGHLVQRPREILEILRDDSPAAAFTPSPSPTFAFPILEEVEKGPEAVAKYQVLDSFRPWWISQRYLAAEERPVPLGETAGFLLILGAAGLVVGLAGLGILRVGSRGSRVEG